MTTCHHDEPKSLPIRRRFITDGSWRRYQSASGDTVVAGSPLRLFRFAAAARSLLESLEKGQQLPDESNLKGLNQVIDRLIAADAVHPLFDINDSSSSLISEVTFVIPCKDTKSDSLTRLVKNIPAVSAIIIIDDGSTIPISPISQAVVHRLPTSLGPAGARNFGLSLVMTPLVCFIDSDIELPPGARQGQFWNSILRHFDDPRIGLVAPRVQSLPGTSILERYEMTDSPLDMGFQPARLHLQGRLSYVPSALVVVRSKELAQQGGFDETLRFGEDVDLIWRLLSRGIICRYEPQVVVHHQPRPNWSALARQRFFYGTAAACLDARHPGNLAPLRFQKWTATAWCSALTGHPIIAAIITGISGMRLRRSLPINSTQNFERDIIASRLVLRGNLMAGKALAEAVNRTWWPALAVASIGSKRARQLWLIAIIFPTMWKWKSRKSDLNPYTYVGARVFDDLCYSAGVWAGVLKTRRVGPLKPQLT